jgi:GNAT superfamily N-acetyltransferase
MAKKLTKILVKEFSTIKEMEQCLPLINLLYPKITLIKYKKSLKEMIHKKYKMLAIYHNDKIIAICGYYISYMFYCGRYMQLCNLVVDKNYRSRGIGSKIIKYLEKKAKKLDCNKMVLDSYIHNKRSHSLYFEQGFYMRGFHFMKNIITYDENS